MTYAQLYALVADVVSAFIFHGIEPGDRVASYSSNCIVRIFLGHRRKVMAIIDLYPTAKCRSVSRDLSHWRNMG